MDKVNLKFHRIYSVKLHGYLTQQDDAMEMKFVELNKIEGRFRVLGKEFLPFCYFVLNSVDSLTRANYRFEFWIILG